MLPSVTWMKNVEAKWINKQNSQIWLKKKEQTDNANTNAEEKDLANDTCGPPYRRANRYVGIPSNTRVHWAAVMRVVLCDSLEIVEEEKERPEVDKFTGCSCEQVSY